MPSVEKKSFAPSVMLARLFSAAVAARLLSPALAPAPQLVNALERGERPQAVFYFGEGNARDSRDDLLRRLVARRGLVERDVAVGVDDDACLSVLVVNGALRERARGLAT